MKPVLAANNQYGIENLKATMKFAFLAVNEGLTIDKNNDGDISFSEIFSSVTTLSFRFPQLQEAYPWLKKEFKDLTDDEIADLKTFVNEELDLPMKYDDIEEAIKLTINMLHYNYNYVRKMQVILQKDTAVA